MGILLANHNDPYNQRLAVELLRRELPITAIVSDNLSFFTDKKIPAAVKLFDVYEFYYRDRVIGLNQSHTRILTSQEIKSYYELESLFLKITDRLSFWPLAVRVRLDLYYELLLFWLHFFDTHRLDLVIFSQTPHTGFDNIIYYVAKQRGIRVVVVTPTLINDRVLLRHDYEYSKKVPRSYQSQATKSQLIDAIKPVFYQDVFGDSTWLDIGKHINTRVLKNNSSNVVTRTLGYMLKQFTANPEQSWQLLWQRTKNSGFVFTGHFTNLSQKRVGCLL
jgi:hypothetical protein